MPTLLFHMLSSDDQVLCILPFPLLFDIVSAWVSFMDITFGLDTTSVELMPVKVFSSY